MVEQDAERLDDAYISEIFNKFAGELVDVRLKDASMDINGEAYHYKEPYLPDDEPTIKAIADLAAEHGLELRIWLPGTGGRFERDDRLNMFIEELDNGQYRVAPTFFIG